jgi:hypothetical protein
VLSGESLQDFEGVGGDDLRDTRRRGRLIGSLAEDGRSARTDRRADEAVAVSLRTA